MRLNSPRPTAIFCVFPHSKALLLLFIAASGLFFSTTIFGQSIGNWTFNNTLTGTPGTFNTVSNADFSLSIPTRSFNGGTEYFGENGWPTGSINTSMYMEFSLTPLSGYQLDISSLVLKLRRSNTGSPAGSGPTSWSLRSSLDGFTTNIASNTMTHTYTTFTVTPGSGFTNIYSTITFRLYGYNTTVSSGGNSRFVIDNIGVNGIGYILPSKLGALTAAIAGKKVNLGWTIYQTQMNEHYTIERSMDGMNFYTAYTTEETGEYAEKRYAYTDDITQFAETDQLYYRLKLSPNNGVAVYSPVVLIKVNGSTSVKAFIANQQLCITGNFPLTGKYCATVFNTSGQIITSILFSATNGYNAFTFALNRNLTGNYVIRISNGSGYTNSRLIHIP